ncbi:LacI family DNA-binding transcriptional regulator [Labrenzia aggregata]|uniref:LacI family DNA-binding transcriptional regulator n=2 Tax=Roseibium aggregatum TaxID=187304 RepID=A0A939IZ32_9HYPH|nr:LacI family DNA-binding transcriptional regulator [Roseibium aggregatum]
MATVGRMAGVSQVTVSRALSDPSKVSQETLKKIRDAIDATGFVPNAIAGALASQKSMLVSVLVPSITNITYTSMISPFNAVMRENGYEVLLSETGFDLEDEEKLIAAHLSRRPDAMLLTGIRHTGAARRALLGASIPIVEVWDVTETPIDQCVGFSHSEAGRAVADFVIDSGYERAGSVSAGDERALRRKTAFAERFARRSGTDVAEVNFEAQASLANGRAGLAELIDQQGFKNGVIFCSSDILALGIMVEARARGLSVPEDVAVIGFGDQDFAAHTDPAITTVRVDREALGREAAKAMLKRFSGQTPLQPFTDIGFEIVRRKSC